MSLGNCRLLSGLRLCMNYYLKYCGRGVRPSMHEARSLHQLGDRHSAHSMHHKMIALAQTQSLQVLFLVFIF